MITQKENDISKRAVHSRFDRKIYCFKSDFTGSLAKWLVKQSPYVVPDNLAICIAKFYLELDKLGDFDDSGMGLIDLASLTPRVNEVLKGIPEVVALSECKNGNQAQHQFISRHCAAPDPDDDFIDIMAVAQNISCDFAEREDAQCHLDRERDSLLEP